MDASTLAALIPLLYRRNSNKIVQLDVLLTEYKSRFHKSSNKLFNF